jgi:hypothetical protein
VRRFSHGAVGHCGLPQRLPALFLLSWLFLSVFFIGRFIADRALPLFVGFRYVQHYQSDYLFI